jgi:hypothetical protein
MTGRGPYATPAAFREGLNAALEEKTKTSRWTLPVLQRHIAYDRLLERLYLVDDGWVVKGATALLARDIGVRGTLDIDIYRAKARDVAEADLRAAAGMDIGDWFRFEIGPAEVVQEGRATRLAVAAYVGTTIWQEFHIDLVGTELQMTGEPEYVEPLARILIPNVEQHGYRAYPLVDHVADKVVATFQRYGSGNMSSTRYRDLVDLVAIISAAGIEADPQMAALTSEAGRRGVSLPPRFGIPDRDLWEDGYAREATRSLLRIAQTLDEALAFVGPFLDPLLDGTAVGAWDPEQHRWGSFDSPSGSGRISN